MARITLTEQVMDKIYILIRRGLRDEEIAYTVGCSVNTVHRVKGVATAIRDGNPETIEKNFYNNAGKIVQWAHKKFNAPKPAEKTALPDNTAACMAKVITLLEQNNALLYRLCTAWGVEDKERGNLWE